MVASCSGRFTLMEGGPGAHWLGGWVGLRANVYAVAKKKIPASAGRPALRLVNILTELPRLQNFPSQLQEILRKVQEILHLLATHTIKNCFFYDCMSRSKGIFQKEAQ
jgi:hypothetical protein